MMSPKQHAAEIFPQLPDDCTFEDIHYQLELRAKVAQAFDDVQHGRTVAHEEAKKRVMQWLESSGPIKG